MTRWKLTRAEIIALQRQARINKNHELAGFCSWVLDWGWNDFNRVAELLQDVSSGQDSLQEYIQQEKDAHDGT